MAEPKVRFKKDDGSSYPAWEEYALDDILMERNEPHLITDDAPQLSFTIEQGVIYPQDKKTNKRDFLMKDKDNKKFLLTEYNDIIYNPANLKFGAIHRNALGRGVVSPIYAIFSTDQNPEFIEGIVTNPAFIKRSLKYLEGTVEKLKTLKPRDFVKMHVWIPCFEEQQKIADFLSSVDEVITASEQEVANLETQKKAVMKKLFSQEVRFKRADGSEFSEWEDIHISDMLTICHGRDYKHLKEGNIPVMGTGGVISYVDEALCDWECVCIGRKGTIDRPYYMNEPFWSVDTLFYTKPKDGFLPKYQFYVFQNIDWKFYNEATGVPSLSASTIEKISVSVASLEEQRLIADFLSDFDEAIAAAKKELELWKELKKGLLQQMFV